MMLVPLFDLKFRHEVAAPLEELQIGGTSAPLPKFVNLAAFSHTNFGSKWALANI
jgi:hypothetical protein